MEKDKVNEFRRLTFELSKLIVVKTYIAIQRKEKIPEEFKPIIEAAIGNLVIDTVGTEYDVLRGLENIDTTKFPVIQESDLKRVLEIPFPKPVTTKLPDLAPPSLNNNLPQSKSMIAVAAGRKRKMKGGDPVILTLLGVLVTTMYIDYARPPIEKMEIFGKSAVYQAKKKCPHFYIHHEGEGHVTSMDRFKLNSFCIVGSYFELQYCEDLTTRYTAFSDEYNICAAERIERGIEFDNRIEGLRSSIKNNEELTNFDKKYDEITNEIKNAISEPPEDNHPKTFRRGGKNRRNHTRKLTKINKKYSTVRNRIKINSLIK